MSKKYDRICLDGQWQMEWFEFCGGLTKKAYKKEYIPQSPITAQVPGIVRAALFNEGMIYDPYFEENNEKSLWVEEKEWWFYKAFHMDSFEGDDIHELKLDGVAYRADIWLNGILVGNTEGMFRKFTFDISPLINIGENKLVLRIRPQEGARRESPGGDVPRMSLSSTGVVPKFCYYWNWSPHLVPIGIWKSVNIIKHKGIKIEKPFVSSEIKWASGQNAESAEIKVSFDISAASLSEEVGIRCSLYDFASKELVASKEMKIKDDNIAEIVLEIVKPKLWWPNGMGEQCFYEAKIALTDKDENVLSKEEIKFGIREIEMVPNEDDEWVQDICGHSNREWSIVGKPYPWTFVVNKKRMFVKGTNWVPADNLFRLTDERYNTFLVQAKEAGINMLRVWGGGIQEPENFYDICDELGLLTWTEFWLACSSYPALPHNLFLDSAKDMITELRNHPSLALWVGGNEYNPDEQENKLLIDKLSNLCKKYDSTRRFHRGSPYRGDRHGGMVMIPTRTTNKYNDVLSGDSRLVLLRSEIAVGRSAPVMDSVKRFISEENMWPINKKVWEYHHAKYPEMEKDAKEYGATDSLKHWIMAGQISHGQIHRHNMEFCRQNMYRISGCMQWQLNGSWPSFHRELIDWYGVPKPAFYAYKRAMKDIIAVVDMEKYIYDANENFSASVYAVNGLYEPIDVEVKVSLFDDKIQCIEKIESYVELLPDSSQKAFDVSWRIPEDYLKKIFYLRLEVLDEGELISDNLYWMGTSEYIRPDELLVLDGIWEAQLSSQTAVSKIKIPGQYIALDKSEHVTFKKEIFIPEEYKNQALEFYCAGLEGHDEVYLNGQLIGSNSERNFIIKRIELEDGNFPDQLKAKQKESDDKKRLNKVFSSDPITAPNIEKSFYGIPHNIVKWGEENIVEIKLYGNDRVRVSESLFIRKETADEIKEKIVALDDEGGYLSGMRDIPEAKLDVAVMQQSINEIDGSEAVVKLKVINTSENLAFFTEIKIVAQEEFIQPIFSDNYCTIMPSGEKEICVKILNTKKFTGVCKFSVCVDGWNIAAKEDVANFTIEFK